MLSDMNTTLTIICHNDTTSISFPFDDNTLNRVFNVIIQGNASTVRGPLTTIPIGLCSLTNLEVNTARSGLLKSHHIVIFSSDPEYVI